MTPDIQALFTPGARVVGQTILLGYGKANYSNTLATYACMKVSAPFNRVTAIASGKRHGQINCQPAGRHDMNGQLLSGQIEHEQGTVILLQASWKWGGSSLRDAALFLRLRHGAPLYTVQAHLPTEPDNTYGDKFRVFTGYADLMSADELDLLGIDVNRSYRGRFMSIEEVEECFSVEQVHPESISRPQLSAIATPTGVELREVAQEAPRRLILRRK